MADDCAMCSTAEEPLHARSVLERFEVKVNTTLFCVSAARGIAERAGLGKVKVLAVNTPWLQAIVRDRGLQIKSVSSKANNADLRRKVDLWQAERLASRVWYGGPWRKSV